MKTDKKIEAVRTLMPEVKHPELFVSDERVHRMYAPLWKEIIWAIKETKLYNYLKGKL